MSFPGLGYYSNATQILRMLSERPAIDRVETIAILVRTWPL